MLRKQKESQIKLEEKNKEKEKVSLWQRMQSYKSKINAKLQNNEKMFAGGGHGLVSQKSITVLAKVLLPIVIVAILVGAIYGAIFNKPQNLNTNPIDPELARAMEYDRVYPGEENIPEAEGIKFDALFLRNLDDDDVADKVRGTCNQIGKEDTLYMELNVMDNARLENGVIEINGDRNFYFETVIVKDAQVKDNYIGENVSKIELETIGSGTQKLLTGVVKSGNYTNTSRIADAIGNDINKYSYSKEKSDSESEVENSKKRNSVTLTGTYINEDTKESKQISKTVYFDVDWYGAAKCELVNINQIKTLSNTIDEENKKLNLEFEITLNEPNKQLNLKKSEIEATIPQLNEYSPLNVEVINAGVTYNYDTDTRILTAESEGSITEEGIIETYPTTMYRVKVQYEKEAYDSLGVDTVEIKIPVQAKFEAYNNPNNEFKNPYITKTASDTLVVTYRNPQEYVAKFDVIVGERASKPTWRYIVSKRKALNIYNEVSESESNDTYEVRWHADMGAEGKTTGIVMKETEDAAEKYQSDEFIKVDSQAESMEEVTRFIGIYFSDPTSILGEDGEIKVYDDETGILLATFNKENWNRYSSSRPYMYELPVKHIKIETSDTNANSSFSVYHVKELDDETITSNYERENFDKLSQIKSTLIGYAGGKRIDLDTETAIYEAPISIANISTSKTVLSTQETEENFEIKIKTEANEQYNGVKWTNGAFLLKLPKDIIDVEINSVNISDSEVTLVSYEEYEEEIASEAGKNENYRFIKINTENDKESSYTITVNCNITPDPRILTSTENIELYAYNENNPNYYYSDADTYDVNDNLNEVEQVNKRQIALNLVSPNSLLTSQVASEYDAKGSIAVAPQKAIISKEQGKAKVTIEINNNYSKTINEVKIIGKIPKKENTYVINGTNMGSGFDAELTGKITLPEKLQEGTKIYYSYEDKVTKEINDGTSNWMDEDREDIDFTKVKSFLIDLQDRQLEKEEKHEISYEINIPKNLQYNQVSYSHHAVYFSLDTEHGKYRTQTEPNKIGFMIAKQYDLELTKYQLGTKNVVAGATYSIEELLEDNPIDTDMQQNEVSKENKVNEVKTRVTLEDGKFTLKDLYLDRTYIVKEIKSPEKYGLNEDEIKFKVKETEQGLAIEKIGQSRGTIKGLEMQKAENADNKGNEDKLVLEVQDEVEASLVITKVEKQDGQEEIPVVGARFKLTESNSPESEKIVTSNSGGKVNIKGIEIGKEYTLEEVKAEGYYLARTIKFKITHEEGQDYKIEIIEPTEGEETPITEGTVQLVKDENNMPTASFTMVDEKIPRYTIEMTKIEKVTDATLTEDKLMAKAQSEFENTEVTPIRGAKFELYKGTKQIGIYETNGEGKITLDNLYAYEETKKVEQTYTLKEIYAPKGYAKVKDIIFRVEKTEEGLKFQETIEDGQTAKKYQIEGNVINLIVEDNPSFRLIKKDKETQSTIADVKFAIYNVDDEEVPARNSKEEIIGEKEIINGKEYYTVKTDNNGQLTADLPEGLYKAIELEAPEQYDTTNKIYYFGIGASREGIYEPIADWATSVGGSNSDYITCITESSDGGYIVGGYFHSSSITVGETTLKSTLTSHGGNSDDGMLIKYNQDGEVDWATSVGGDYNEKITCITKTSDGGFIVGGYFNSTSIVLGGGHILTNKSYDVDGMLIKYKKSNTKEGEYEVEWATSVGGEEGDYINSIATASDEGFIVGGYFGSDSITIGETTLTNEGSWDGMLIKYRKAKEGDNTDEKYIVDWATSVGGNSGDEITCITETSDGGYIVGGYFHSSSITVGETTLTNNRSSTSYRDGMLIKYKDADNANGYEVDWATSVGGEDDDYINSIATASDGGFIVGGIFDYFSITVGDKTIEEPKLIKYKESENKEGYEVEWATSVGVSSGDNITCITETSDGGIFVGGCFTGSITVGSKTLPNEGDKEGMLIKYKKSDTKKGEYEVEWATSVGGNSRDEITCITETSDGGYICRRMFF